jgi:cyclic beta-1,2-glucan synthetase
MGKTGDLSGRVGAVLDPVFAIRARTSVPAGESIDAVFTTHVSDSREAAIRSVEANRDHSFRERSNGGVEDEAEFQDLAGALLFPETYVTTDRSNISSSQGTDERLVVLASVQLLDGMSEAKKLIRAQRYLEQKGLNVQLVILAHGDKLADELISSIGENQSGVRVLQSDSLENADLARINGGARVRIDCDGSGIAKLLESSARTQEFTHGTQPRLPEDAAIAVTGDSLRFFNGIGGFNDRGEYEIRLEGSSLPPLHG